MKIRARLLTVGSEGDRREKERHVLQLDVTLAANAQGIDAAVQDLSTAGLRIETEVSLEVGEDILVELVDTQSVEARVVWKNGNVYGCQFRDPIAKRVVGMVVLQAPFEEPLSGWTTQVEEVPLGKDIGVDLLAQWYADFEQRRTSSGEQLLGFRQVGNHIVALISRLS
jgi:PilZ domain